MAGHDQVERYEEQVHELQSQVKFLEEEVGLLRRRLSGSPRQVAVLEEKLVETRDQLARATGQNQKLADALRGGARADRAPSPKRSRSSASRPRRSACSCARTTTGRWTSSPPGARCASCRRPTSTSQKIAAGLAARAERVAQRGRGPGARRRRRGREGQGPPRRRTGRSCSAAATTSTSPTWPASSSTRACAPATPRCSTRGRSWSPSCCPREEVEELVLEEIPDVGYEDIGGLEGQIDLIRDAVELPFLYAELFNEHELEPPKGVLLYGPPGCGKTLIAKAVAKSLAEKVAERSGSRRRPQLLLEREGPRAAQQVRRRDRAADPRDLHPRQGAQRRGPAGDRVLRRDGLDLPHPRHGHLLRRRVDDRAAAAVRARRRRDPQERDRDRGLEPRGPDRPRDPAARPPRREDQDRAARTRRRRWTSCRSTCTRRCRSTPTRSSATAATSRRRATA